MSVAKAPAPEAEPAPSRTVGVRALRAGLLAWLPLALGGQLLAWTAYLVTGAFRPWSWVKIGLLNTIAVARVTILGRVEAPPGLRPLDAGLLGVESFELTLALGAGTIVALVLLFRAGREAAGKVGRSPRDAAVASAAVAVGFALPMGLSSLLVSLRFPTIDVAALRPVVWQAFAFPFVLGVVAGGIGGLAAASPTITVRPIGRRVVAAARGGWSALAWGVLLALLGTLLLAALRPGPSAAYARWLDARGPGGAVLAMYHALLLPNGSVDVLAISMGSCTELAVGDRTASVCLGGVAADEELTGLFGPEGSVTFGPPYLAFLLVPVFATVAGGRRAARGVRSRGERLVRAAWAGAVFGVSVGLAAWTASIVLVGDGETVASLGADPIETAALGVLWGVVGGALGAAFPDRAGTPEEPRTPAQAPEGLPSDTSLK